MNDFGKDAVLSFLFWDYLVADPKPNIDGGSGGGGVCVMQRQPHKSSQ